MRLIASNTIHTSAKNQTVVREIRFLMSKRDLSIILITRRYNGLADWLANLAKRDHQSRIWENDLPGEFAKILYA